MQNNPHFEYHKKPTGELICPICGTDNVRAGVKHRALKADEIHQYGARYEKIIKTSFGADFDRVKFNDKT